MEQKGVFRSALGGFHKQDVLNYIDGITAEWNEERVLLTEQAQTDRELAQQQQDAAAEAITAREAAEQVTANLQTENTRLQEVLQELETTQQTRLQELETELAELRRLPEQVQALTEQLREVTAQRDVAVAEKSKLTEQLHIETDRANTATSEMMAAEERLQQKDIELAKRNEQLTRSEQSLTHYQSILGDAEDAGRRVGDIARPFIRQAGHQAGEALEDMQATLTAVLAQLGELQGTIEQKKTALQAKMDEADSQMTGAVSAWTDTAKAVAGVDSDRPQDGTADFFR